MPWAMRQKGQTLLVLIALFHGPCSAFMYVHNILDPYTITIPCQLLKHDFCAPCLCHICLDFKSFCSAKVSIWEPLTARLCQASPGSTSLVPCKRLRGTFTRSVLVFKACCSGFVWVLSTRLLGGVLHFVLFRFKA